MTRPRDILIEAGRLAADRRPYAFATVVRVERPTSAREGNHALITPDGAVIGWIGGACSEPTVVREALRALADGKPRLVAIEGSCASEGLVEVFIEPQLPEPLLSVVGDGPAAATLVDLAVRIGWRVERAVREDADAVVVATLGSADEAALRAALATPAAYVGLVASRRRGRSTLAALRESGCDEADLARVRCPAGLDLGPSTQEEIAVAILAELVAWRHTQVDAPAPPAGLHGRMPPAPVASDTPAPPAGLHGRMPPAPVASDTPAPPAGLHGRMPPASVASDTPAPPAGLHGRMPPASVACTDPVCGMTVSADVAGGAIEHEEITYYFCSVGCRTKFERDPHSFVRSSARTG